MKNLEFNKIIAAILLAGIAILGVSNIVDIIYQPKKMTEYGYVVAVTDATTTTAGGGEAAFDITRLDISALLAKANIESGKIISKKCVACHTFENGGHNKVGPNLWEIVGNKKAHLGDKFNYSKGLLGKGGQWDYQALFEFLHKPQTYIKGTKMSFMGLSKPEQLADVILYLHSLSDSPLPLPTLSPTPPTAPSTTSNSTGSAKNLNTSANTLPAAALLPKSAH